MTTSTIKVKVVRRPSLKLKVLPRFPANVTVTSPITLDRTGGNYGLGFDVSKIGNVPASSLPNPTASTLGGVESAATVAHNWINSISTSGVPALSQPAFSDISGTVAASQIAANTITNAMHATMPAWTFKANNTSGAATPTDITIDGLTLKATPAAGDELILWDVAGAAIKKATVSSVAAGSAVASIAGNTGAFTLNSTSGITNSTNDIILQQASASQFGAVKVDNTTVKATAGVISTTNPLPTPITNSLGANVALNNTANYFDGPSVAQGATGTWWASGTVTVTDTGSAQIYCKLWDGTTVIASTAVLIGANILQTISLSGFIASPAGNIRMSCRDVTATTGSILFNQTGNSKDSTISARRIA